PRIRLNAADNSASKTGRIAASDLSVICKPLLAFTTWVIVRFLPVLPNTTKRFGFVPRRSIAFRPVSTALKYRKLVPSLAVVIAVFSSDSIQWTVGMRRAEVGLLR